ncbi:MAG: hypothetical protein GY786_13150, partial [Proteobacteria bacterium]|nr:hypothetical protein [Pseudomonadota bacterium]
MREKKTVLQTILNEEKNEPKAQINDICCGRIVKIDFENDIIWVDHNNNSSGRPIAAELASPFVTLKHLKRTSFIANKVQLDFKNGDPLQPVIRDIFFSINDLELNKDRKIVEETLHIKADRIILEGASEVIIRSGDVKTTYSS